MVIFTSGEKRVFFKEKFLVYEFASKAQQKYKLLLYLYNLIYPILFFKYYLSTFSNEKLKN